jgi:MFS family permease
MPLSRSNPLHAPDRPQPYAHPARLILILSLTPTVGLGIGRFAYSLVLPDMRDALGWSYSAAGFMNTINAAGYLAGALAASQIVKRFGYRPRCAGEHWLAWCRWRCARSRAILSF